MTYYHPLWESKTEKGEELKQAPSEVVLEAIGMLNPSHARNKFGYESGRSHAPDSTVVPPIKWRRDGRTHKDYFGENNSVWIWASKQQACCLLQTWISTAGMLAHGSVPKEAILRLQSVILQSEGKVPKSIKGSEELYANINLWDEESVNWFDEDEHEEEEEDEIFFWSPSFEFRITGVGGSIYLCRFESLHSVYNSSIRGFTKYMRSSETFFDEYVSGQRTRGRFVWPMSSEGNLWTLGDWPAGTYTTQSEFWRERLAGFHADKFKQLIDKLPYQGGSPRKPTRRKASAPDCIEVLKQDLIEAVGLCLMPFIGSGFDEATSQVLVEKTDSDQIGITFSGGSAAPVGQILVNRINEWLYTIITSAPQT